MKKRIFLSGPIFQCDDHECMGWRQEVKRRLPDFVVFNPMDRDFRGRTDQFCREIVEDDKKYIDQSDILLVNHLKPSVGTSMEILYAWERGKHIVIISGDEERNPWMIYHSHKICVSLDDAISYVKNLVLI